MKENKINYEKCHKKASSELVPITSSNFHLSLKKNLSNTLHMDGERNKLFKSKL